MLGAVREPLKIEVAETYEAMSLRAEELILH